MNDIAAASNKGRRTLYTYFSNKEQIYLAVIEQELNILNEKLQRVATCHLPPDKKLIEYIFTRLDAVKELISRNGSLQSDFFRDIYEVEKARRRFDVNDMDMLQSIFEEGRAKGYFQIKDPELSAQLFHYALKGIETPYYFRNKVRLKMQENRQQLIDIFMKGILNASLQDTSSGRDCMKPSPLAHLPRNS